jgi:hypothetical protein
MTNEVNSRDVPDKLGRTGAAKGGRKPGTKSSRTPRQKKLAEVLNKLNPIVAKALAKAEAILDADLEKGGVSATVQLQAAKLVIDKAIELTNECYKPDTPTGEAPQDDDEEEEGAAILSFTVVDGKK